MMGIAVWQVVGWTARLLLLGLVIFWWGGYVATHLFSLAFPELLRPSNPTLGRLDANSEGTIANAVSAATLASVTLLALATAVVSRRRSAGWITVGGWAALALTTAALAYIELLANKRSGPISVFAYADRLGLPWTVLVSPLIVAFVLAMWLFVRKGLGTRAVRAPLTLGIACWVFALVHDALDAGLFAGRASAIAYVIEETLEYSGALLIGLSAVIALRHGRPPPHPLFGGRWRRSLVGSLATVVVLGGLAAVFLFRAPLVEAPAAHMRAGAFGVILADQEAVVQEIRMPATPVQRLRLLLSNCQSSGPPGTIAVRVTPIEMTDRILAEGSVQVPAGDCPRWYDIELLPPLTAAEGESLALQVSAVVAPGAELRVGATKGDRYRDGRLWVNGALAWPDQNLEFVAYSAPEPTWSKLLALGRLLATDLRWWLLAVDLGIALTLITLIPALLLASIRPRAQDAPGSPDSHRPTTQ